MNSITPALSHRAPVALNPSAASFQYQPLAIWLHWATATLILTLLTTGFAMKQLGEGAWADELAMLHRTLGPITLVLIVVRLAYRISARLAGRWRSDLGSHPLHRLLYGLALLVPLVGWAGASDFNARGMLFGFELPAIWPVDAGYADTLFTLHAYLAFTLIGVVVLHIGVALGHHVFETGMQPSPVAISPGSDRGSRALADLK